MSNPVNKNGKGVLERIARRVMKERGFQPDFSIAALDELKNIQGVDWSNKTDGKDLRQLPWASIDNADSLDLDQLTVADKLSDNRVKLFIAVADVDIALEIEGKVYYLPERALT